VRPDAEQELRSAVPGADRKIARRARKDMKALSPLHLRVSSRHGFCCTPLPGSGP
jgi:hypothetical protein